MFWSAGYFILRAYGFFCNLDDLYGGLGINKLQSVIKNIKFLIQLLTVFKFWSSNPRSEYGLVPIQPEMLEPDPESINPDPTH